MRLLVLLAVWVGMGCGTALAGTCSDGTVCDVGTSLHQGDDSYVDVNGAIDEALGAAGSDAGVVVCLDAGAYGSEVSLDYPDADITLCTADTLDLSSWAL